MNNTIDFIHISAKIPGYLFILAKLTDPGDVIFLNCPWEKRGFISSMLALIGLRVQSRMHCPEETRQESIILSVYEDLPEIRQTKSNNATEIVLLPYQLPIQQFEHYAMGVLSQNPYKIIIDEVQDLTDSKTFSIALSKESQFYARLKQKIGFNLI